MYNNRLFDTQQKKEVCAALVCALCEDYEKCAVAFDPNSSTNTASVLDKDCWLPFLAINEERVTFDGSIFDQSLPEEFCDMMLNATLNIIADPVRFVPHLIGIIETWHSPSYKAKDYRKQCIASLKRLING